MNILNYGCGADTGGQSWAVYQAFKNAAPDIGYSSLVRSSNYIQYPKHLPVTQFARAVAAADVVHIHNAFRILEGVNKPLVMHWHGTGFRENPAPYIRQLHQFGALGVVATVDLLAASDELTWVPPPVDIEALSAMWAPKDNGKIRVGHCPTNREIKSTGALMAAVKRAQKHHPYELVLVERKTWAECLKIKATCDLLFDQVQLGFGVNAVEAWGMGMPVIAGAGADTLAVMRDTFGGSLPFYQADEDSIYEALMELADETTRKEWGDIGGRHVERFHSQRAVVDILTPIYEEAATTTPPTHPPRPLHRGPRRRGRARR